MFRNVIKLQIVRFGTVGLLINIAGYCLFLAFLFEGLTPVTASSLTYITTLLTSYLVNRSWTFQSSGSHARDIPRYLIAYLAGLVAATGIMHLLSAFLHPAQAQIAVILLSAVVIYASLGLLRFGRTVGTDAD